MTPPRSEGSQKLQLRQLEPRLEIWRDASQRSPMPRRGWLHAMRTALGMTEAQLAERIGVHRSWIGQLERGETSGSSTLASLQRAAEAMGARVVVGLVPEQGLEEILDRQAERVAARMMAEVEQTMVLEDQRPSESYLRTEKERLKQDLLRGSWRRLWD